ncbi:MAG: DUF1223 domain-containing protein [Parvibaculum sp.]|uniref:DUF1223 domain-containing protein n=1 Tax=Parvibaculum sp. TaxID=2024848 RepID=UPI00271DBB15|nr:DUF1223 domain-containing protein [Parvibaculum sp.]MDO8837707.1 DUF1223 domain-containing protein [Parvibaculum sp.]
MLLRYVMVLVLGLSLASIARAETRPVVVELFTSQGCSSCPKADAYLAELAGREDVIALSFAVDYWDFLGWKDTLASPAFTKRQRAYAKALGISGVYTPQIVVDGIAEGVGSHRETVEEQIADRRGTPLPVALRFSDDGAALTLHVGAGAPPERAATLWLVRYAKKERVEIRRGENRGKTMTYAHAVRGLMPIGMWEGDATTVTLPKTEMLMQGYEGCVALLQARDGGPILGAAHIDMAAAAERPAR